jgi:DNA-binding NtrC family response regulator
MEQRNKHDMQLSGVSVLVVEDDLLILMELESVLSDAGAQIVGGCHNVRAALALTRAEGLSVALLDLQLGQESILPVARDLAERGIPFVFYTGQVELEQVRSEWPQCKVVQKPAPARAIVAAIADVLARAVAERQSAAT